MSRPDHIISLCASHIDTLERMSLLQLMIQSWHSNTVQIPLFISLSYDEYLQEDILNTISQMREMYPLLTVNISNVKLAQFEHYKILSETVVVLYSPSTFIIFSDDDDLWSENRVELYKNCISQFHDIIHSVSSIKMCGYYTCDGASHPDMRYISNFAQLQNYKNLIKVIDTVNIPGEYWQYCVPIKYFQEFMTKASDDLLKHKYCDLTFTKFIYFYNPENVKIVHLPKDRIGYFYRYLKVRNVVNPEEVVIKATHENISYIHPAMINNIELIAARNVGYDNVLYCIKKDLVASDRPLEDSKWKYVLQKIETADLLMNSPAYNN